MRDALQHGEGVINLQPSSVDNCSPPIFSYISYI